MRSRQQAVAAAHEVAGDADGGAASSLQRQSLRGQRLIDIEQRNAGAHRDKARGLVDDNPVQAAHVDRDVGGLRKPLIGIPAAPHCKIQVVAADPVDRDRHRVVGFADRAQARAQLLAPAGCRKKIGIMPVRRRQESHVAGGNLAAVAVAPSPPRQAADPARVRHPPLAVARKGNILRRETDVPLKSLRRCPRRPLAAILTAIP